MRAAPSEAAPPADGGAVVGTGEPEAATGADAAAPLEAATAAADSPGGGVRAVPSEAAPPADGGAVAGTGEAEAAAGGAETAPHESATAAADVVVRKATTSLLAA